MLSSYPLFIFVKERTCVSVCRVINASRPSNRLDLVFFFQIIEDHKKSVSFRYFAEVLVAVKLTKSNLFHSHLEGLPFLAQNEFKEQVCRAK